MWYNHGISIHVCTYIYIYTSHYLWSISHFLSFLLWRKTQMIFSLPVIQWFFTLIQQHLSASHNRLHKHINTLFTSMFKTNEGKNWNDKTSHSDMCWQACMHAFIPVIHSMEEIQPIEVTKYDDASVNKCAHKTVARTSFQKLLDGKMAAWVSRRTIFPLRDLHSDNCTQVLLTWICIYFFLQTQTL